MVRQLLDLPAGEDRERRNCCCACTRTQTKGRQRTKGTAFDEPCPLGERCVVAYAPALAVRTSTSGRRLSAIALKYSRYDR